MTGAKEWLAQKSKPARDPVVLHGNADDAQMSYAAEQDKPHWLVTAFPVDRK
jgi:hypothetical protein